MKTTDIKRKSAAKLIDDVAQFVAELEEGHYKKHTPGELGNMLRTILSAQGIMIPRRCEGEAHSNPHIDNCGVCMPNWGWVSSPTKVK